MATSAPVLADDIATNIGHPGDVTSQVLGFATGVLQELTTNGMGTPGAPTSSISGMTGSSMADFIKTAVGYPSVSTELGDFCDGIVSHIQGSGLITYSNPPTYTIGTIGGLSGSGMATSVQSSVGYPSVSTELLGLCTAIADHINGNASVLGGSIS